MKIVSHTASPGLEPPAGQGSPARVLRNVTVCPQRRRRHSAHDLFDPASIDAIGACHRTRPHTSLVLVINWAHGG
jgi:hypothetical protein